VGVGIPNISFSASNFLYVGSRKRLHLFSLKGKMYSISIPNLTPIWLPKFAFLPIRLILWISKDELFKPAFIDRLN